MSAKKRKNNPRRRRRGHQQQPPQPPPSPPAAVPPVLGQANPPVDGGNGNGNNGGQLPRPDGSINWEWWFAASIAVATIVQAFFGSCQWIATEHQYTAMLNANTVAQTSANAAKAGADAAKDAVNIAREQVRMDQRPWLSVGAIKLNEMVAGKPLKFSFMVRNTGKTPGFTSYSVSDALPVGTSADIDKIVGVLREMHIDDRNTVVAPDSTMRFDNDSAHAWVPSQPMIDEIKKDKTKTLLIYGRVNYHDGAANEYFTYFCHTYVPESDSFLQHPRHNEMK